MSFHSVDLRFSLEYRLVEFSFKHKTILIIGFGQCFLIVQGVLHRRRSLHRIRKMVLPVRVEE